MRDAARRADRLLQVGLLTRSLGAYRHVKAIVSSGEHGRNRLTAPPVQKIVIILGVTVSLWHIQATEKWSNFFSHFRTVLDLNSGIIPSDMLLRPPGTRPAHLAAKMIWSWTNP